MRKEKQRKVIAEFTSIWDKWPASLLALLKGSTLEPHSYQCLDATHHIKAHFIVCSAGVDDGDGVAALTLPSRTYVALAAGDRKGRCCHLWADSAT